MAEHSYNDLMAWDKEQLIQHIINLEHYINMMQEKLNIQANNIRCLLKMQEKAGDNNG